VNLNKAYVLGNVTRDPEVKALPSGQQVTSFSVATNRFYTDASGQKKQDTEFHNIVAFGKLADISSRYLTKGSLVLIEGRIKTRNWQNQQGQKQYRTEIIAESLQLGPKGSGQTGSGGGFSKQQSFSPEPEYQKKDEIPVIDESYAPPSHGTPDESSFQEDQSADEIDVKDIPF